MNYVLCCTT